MAPQFTNPVETVLMATSTMVGSFGVLSPPGAAGVSAQHYVRVGSCRARAVRLNSLRYNSDTD